LGKTTFAVRAAHVLRPRFPDGVFFLDLFGMSQQPVSADAALRLLLRALGVADQQIPGDTPGRASLYRSLLRDKRVLVVLENAASEEQVRPLLPGGGEGGLWSPADGCWLAWRGCAGSGSDPCRCRKPPAC